MRTSETGMDLDTDTTPFHNWHMLRSHVFGDVLKNVHVIECQSYG